MYHTKLFLIFITLLIILNDTYSQSIRVDTIHNEIQNTVGNENWLYLTNKLKELKISATGNVTIVHIGDSHIQGGYLTNTVRSQLYKDYGVADIGWVFPY